MLSILPFSASVLGTMIGNCGTSSRGCLAGLSFGYDNVLLAYTSDTHVSQSTIAYGTSGVTFVEVVAAVQLVSLYVLLFAVLVLIALECVELYYIRQMFGAKRRLSSRS